MIWLENQQVAGLAIQFPAQRFKGAEAYGLGSSVLKYSEVGWGDADAFGQFADGHFAACQHDINIYADSH